MTHFNDMQNLAARLTALAGPALSIADQVVIDGLLYDVGAAIEKLLTENGHPHDRPDPECTLERPDPPDMTAHQANRHASELNSKVYSVLLEVRYALSWDSMPPTTHITQEERDAIFARRYGSPVALIPPETRAALIRVLKYVGSDEKARNHIWPAIRTAWDWLSVSRVEN
jgi:hypothetical protein